MNLRLKDLTILRTIDDKIKNLVCRKILDHNKKSNNTQNSFVNKIPFITNNKEVSKLLYSKEISDFLSFNNSTFNLGKFVLYNYNCDEDFFVVFVIKTITIICLVIFTSFLRTLAFYLSSHTNIFYRQLGVMSQAIYFIIEPRCRYLFIVYFNKCSNTLLKTILTSLTTSDNILTDIEDKTNNLSYLISYGSQRYCPDLYHCIIKYISDMVMYTIFIMVDMYIVNIHKTIFKKGISLITGLTIPVIPLGITGYQGLNQNMSLYQKKSISYYNTVFTISENIIKSKESLVYSKLYKNNIDKLSLLLKDAEVNYNEFIKQYTNTITYRFLPSWLSTFFFMLVLDINVSPFVLNLQETILRETGETWFTLRDIVFRLNVIHNNYLSDYHPESSLEKTYNQLCNNSILKEINNISRIENIKINNLTFFYPNPQNQILEIPIIQNLSTDINKKGLTIILGDSGKGKSTLLNIIAGREDINDSNGQIILNNHIKISQVKDNLIDLISFMPQRTYIYEGCTILYNITFSDKLKPNEDIILTTVIQLCDLDELIQEKKTDYKIYNNPSNLSEGQKKRICLARTFYEYELFNKSVLIADEPTTGLEIESSRRIIKNINNYYCQSQKIIILGLHTGILLDYDPELNINFINL